MRRRGTALVNGLAEDELGVSVPKWNTALGGGTAQRGAAERQEAAPFVLICVKESAGAPRRFHVNVHVNEGEKVADSALIVTGVGGGISVSVFKTEPLI